MIIDTSKYLQRCAEIAAELDSMHTELAEDISTNSTTYCEPKVTEEAVETLRESVIDCSTIMLALQVSNNVLCQLGDN